jgi:monoamine oxidase
MGVGTSTNSTAPSSSPKAAWTCWPRLARDLGSAIRYNAKVTRIAQNDKGVTVDYVDALKPSSTLQARADWCVCTIPLSILSQIEVQAGSAMQNAIAAVPTAAP